MYTIKSIYKQYNALIEYNILKYGTYVYIELLLQVVTREYDLCLTVITLPSNPWFTAAIYISVMHKW
jgi:hypothetical protein